MFLRRLRRLFAGNRRYRGADAAYARPSLGCSTEAGLWERLVRAFRRREVLAYDEREGRAADMFRTFLLWTACLLALGFVVKSLLVMNIFAG